jgi:carbonic anhydrase
MTTTTRFGVASLLVSGAIIACAPVNDSAPIAGETHAPVSTATEALHRLRDGNRRFMDGQSKHDHTSADWRRSLTAGQTPIAIVVGCADSRVPVEIIFDQGLGDLFVIRNAGNVLHTDVVGSIEYAVDHLDTPLVVILGHEQCGAITATLGSRRDRSKEGPELQMVFSLIDPALQAEGIDGTDRDSVAAGVEANVRWSVTHLQRLAADSPSSQAHKLVVVGAVYELESGRVRFLDG